MLRSPGKISPQDVVDQLAGLSFDEKVQRFREMVSEARQTNPSFVAEEYVGTNAEVVFIGAGLRDAQNRPLKNVLVVSRDGSVRVMTAHGVTLTSAFGSFPRVVDVDFKAGSAVRLVD